MHACMRMAAPPPSAPAAAPLCLPRAVLRDPAAAAAVAINKRITAADRAQDIFAIVAQVRMCATGGWWCLQCTALLFDRRLERSACSICSFGWRPALPASP